jgi:hypothetical protein
MTSNRCSDVIATPAPVLKAMAGCIVTRLGIDDSFTLALCGIDREIILRIDGNGEIEQDGTVTDFDPDLDPTSVLPLIGLLNRCIDDVELGNDGRLTLYSRKIRLTVLPSEHNVSWSVRGPDGSGASSIAEGRVVWE